MMWGQKGVIMHASAENVSEVEAGISPMVRRQKASTASIRASPSRRPPWRGTDTAGRWRARTRDPTWRLPARDAPCGARVAPAWSRAAGGARAVLRPGLRAVVVADGAVCHSDALRHLLKHGTALRFVAAVVAEPPTGQARAGARP